MENRENTDPATLVSTIAKPRMINSMLISFGTHFVLLLLLSIGFIGECIEYKTIYPAVEKKRIEKEKAELEKQQKQEEAAKRAQLKAQEQEKKEAEQKKAAPAKEAAPAGGEKKKAAADPYANQMESPDNAKMNEGGIDF